MGKNVITAAQPNAHLLLDIGSDARLHSAGNSETWELPLKGQKDRQTAWTHVPPNLTVATVSTTTCLLPGLEKYGWLFTLLVAGYGLRSS